MTFRWLFLRRRSSYYAATSCIDVKMPPDIDDDDDVMGLRCGGETEEMVAVDISTPSQIIDINQQQLLHAGGNARFSFDFSVIVVMNKYRRSVGTS